MTSFLILVPAINQIQCHRQGGIRYWGKTPRLTVGPVGGIHSLNHVSSKRRPLSFAPKQDVSCRALTQSKKNWPSPDMTLRQEVLWADIASNGPGAPLSYLQTLSPGPFSLEARLCPQVRTESSLLASTAELQEELHVRGGGVRWELGDRFLTCPGAPLLLATAKKASWAPRPSWRVLGLPNPQWCTDLMEQSFHTSLGGSTQSATSHCKALFMNKGEDEMFEVSASFPRFVSYLPLAMSSLLEVQHSSYSLVCTTLFLSWGKTHGLLRSSLATTGEKPGKCILFQHVEYCILGTTPKS